MKSLPNSHGSVPSLPPLPLLSPEYDCGSHMNTSLPCPDVLRNLVPVTAPSPKDPKAAPMMISPPSPQSLG